MRTTILGFLLLFISLANMPAQTVYDSSGPSPTPSQSYQPQVEPVGPTGTDSRFGQFIVSRYQFQNAPVNITSLSFACAGSGALHYQRLILRMGQVTMDFVANTFSQNRPSALYTVLDVRDYTWPVTADEWRDIGLQVPFLYVPAAGNLFVEYQVEQATGVAPPTLTYNFHSSPGNGNSPVHLIATYSGSTVPPGGSGSILLPRMRFGEDLATVAWYGQSCAGSGGQRPGLGLQGTGRLGTTTSIMLSNAQPQMFGLLAFGTAVLPQPQSLGVFGMIGCVRYFDVANSFGVVTSSLGIASYPLGIPNNQSLAGTVLTSQDFVLDPSANPAGIVATNFGRVLAGL